MSDPRTTPHNGGLRNLAEASSKRKKHQPTARATHDSKRMKRRRVTVKSADDAGLKHRTRDLHDLGAHDTFSQVDQERMQVLRTIQSETKREEALPSQEPAVPHPEVCTWSTLATARVAKEAEVDPSQVPLDLLSKWEGLSPDMMREGALMGLMDDEESEQQRRRQDLQNAAEAAHRADQKQPQDEKSAEPSMRVSDWPAMLTLKRLLKNLKGATRLTESTDRYDRFTAQDAQEHLKQLLEKRKSLDVMDASTASLLLAQAGDFPVMVDGQMKHCKFMPCVNGKDCCGHRVRFREGYAVTLMAWMSLEEYNLLLINGTQPRGIERRCCILCYRYWTNYYYVMLMKIRSRIPSAPACFQAWSVDVGVPGGYVSEACLHPPDTEDRGVAFTGLVGPMVRFQVMHYQIQKGPYGRIYWLQDAIVQKPTPLAQPARGQLLGTFLGRVRLEQRLRVDYGIQYYRNMSQLHHPVVCLARNFPALFTRIFPWTKDQSLESIQPEFLVRLEDSVMKECEQRLSHELGAIDALTDQTQCWQTLKGVHQLFGDVRFEALYLRHAGKPLSPALRAHLRWMSPNIFSLGLDIAPHLMQCMFWDEKPPGVYTELVKVLNKLLPQPCTTRMFTSMLNTFIHNTPHGALLISSFCFLALLGSYYIHPGVYRRYVDKDSDTELSPVSLGDEHVFALRCMHFEDPSLINDIHMHTPDLALYSMRAVMYALIRDQPCFYTQLEETMRISQTENVVNSFMVFLRASITLKLDVGVWLRLLAPDASAQWQKRTEALQQSLQDVPTQSGSKEEISQLMLKVQRECVVNSYRVLPFDLVEYMIPALDRTKLLTLYCTYRRRRELALTSLHASQWDECPELSPEIHRVMDQWLSAVGDRVIDPIELAENLRLFPVSQEGFDAIMGTLRRYDELNMNDRGLNVALRGTAHSSAADSGPGAGLQLRRQRQQKSAVPLYERWPQTMAIMRLFSRLYAIHRSCALVPLPRQVLEAQIDAIRRRWLLQPHEPLPFCSNLFLWCSVCQTPYVIYASVPRHTCPSKSRHDPEPKGASHALTGRGRRSKQTNQSLSYFGTTNRRRKVSQRSGKTVTPAAAVPNAEKRGSAQPYGTHLRILKAFDALMQEHREGIRGLDVQAGSRQASKQMRITMRTIRYYEAMRKAPQNHFNSAKHELHTEHAHLEAMRHLRDMSVMLTGRQTLEDASEDEEDGGDDDDDGDGVGEDDEDDTEDDGSDHGRAGPVLKLEKKSGAITEESIRRRGLWQAQALQLNYLVQIREAVGPATNTSDGPQTLKGSGCKRQTGQGYGYWCPISDHISGHTYCRVNHTRDGDDCSKRPLSRTMILGHAFCMGRRIMMMCPNCAGFFVYTQKYCMYTTSKGYLCMSCTEYMRQMHIYRLQAQALGWPLHVMESDVLPLAITPEERKVMQLAAQEPLPVCVYCRTSAVRNEKGFSNTRIYDHGTLVCCRHSYGLNVYLSDHAEEFRDLDKEAYQKKLVTVIRELVRVRPSRTRRNVHFKRRASRQGRSVQRLRTAPETAVELTRGTVRAQKFIKRSQERRHAGP